MFNNGNNAYVSWLFFIYSAKNPGSNSYIPLCIRVLWLKDRGYNDSPKIYSSNESTRYGIFLASLMGHRIPSFDGGIRLNLRARYKIYNTPSSTLGFGD